MLELLLTIALLGFLVYLIVTYIPMPPPFRQIIVVIAVVVLIVVLLRFVGGGTHLLRL